MPESTLPAAAGTAIVNPLSGERIVIHGQRGTGAALAWELVLAPGGRVPGSHAHPQQEERFTVREGRMRFRVGWRRLAAGPGETVRVPPGTVHHFANAGPGPARVWVETVPALAMADLLRTAAALACDQHAAGRKIPRLLDLALFMREFEREVRAPYLPGPLVRLMIRPLFRLAGRCGLDERYGRLRTGAGTAAGASVTSGKTLPDKLSRIEEYSSDRG
jgi:mannose-6-phosphate isomerase-like protein (cupin superfamily)